MRIKRCKLNNDQSVFKSFLKRYGLKRYKYFADKNKPCVFYGLYAPDIDKFQRHKGLIVLVWRGTDATHKDRVKMAKKKSNVKHVAISSFVQKDLDAFSIKYKKIPIASTDISSFNPCALGDEVYVYIPKNRKEFYGADIVDELKSKCKFKINVVGSSNRYSRKELTKVYERCFLGLRLTPHDGLPNQVVEMGLMGRKSVYNGDTPDAIPWNNVEDILSSIEKESENIGSTNLDAASAMRDYVTVSDFWLDTKYWRD